MFKVGDRVVVIHLHGVGKDRGRLVPQYQIVPLTPEQEKEIKAREEFAQQQAADREAILQKRESLHRLFPEKYAPDVSVFTDGKVEIMFSSAMSRLRTSLGL
jgi:hypothetical protein